ncbi:uncharacterized protein LOC133825361 [Humulus lupulus]|uniref:uncharacterized protein LOC133825361 n=1 Tax=Humulus lupulus TaxID=3486 RepID=UPI002B40818B|nr:uncharacterized protein LOC133825361 [Humulus lupulus]
MRNLQSKIITTSGAHSIDDEFDYESPFTREIQVVRFPANFKEPHMTPYEGNTDQKYHFDVFNDLKNLRGINSRARCQYFVVTLKGLAHKWFKRLRPGSIKSWQQFFDEFLQQHHAVRDYTMMGTSLTNVKQGEDESLKNYIHRFNMEAAKVGSLARGELKMAITAGVRLGSKLWDNMLKREVTDLDDFYERVQKYIRVEDGHKSLNARKSESSLKSSTHESLNNAKKKRAYEEPRDDHLGKAKRVDEHGHTQYTFYINLTHTREHIFIMNENYVPFRRPPPMKRDRLKRDLSTYCHYHKDIGHTTTTCNHLKVEIEELIRRGHLGKYVTKEKPGPEGRPTLTRPNE